MEPRAPDNTAGSTTAGLLPVTHWSVVLQAREKSDAALSALCQSYRGPLLTWLRIRGQSPEDAEDSVQGFFARLLQRDFLANVARDKGRFRTFLLTSLQRYLIDEGEKRNATKRGGGQRVESLDETDDEGRRLHEPAAATASPDLEYDRAWARTVLANASHRLELECAATGQRALYTALEPVMLADETASPYREIGQKLAMSGGAVKVAAHRIRGRLKLLIRDEILQTVAGEQEFEPEVRYLISLFAR